MEYLTLAACWSAWCIAHSALIDARVTRYLRQRLGGGFRFHRLAFNVFSLAALAPVLFYTWELRGEVLWRWDGWLRLVQAGLGGGSALLFYLGARRYDLLQFIGLRQICSGRAGKGLTASGGVDDSAILGAVRHPWYAAGIIVVWVRALTAADLIASAIITAYMIVGCVLEERKLVREFGTEYEAYQRRVPMLVPWKWALTRVWRLNRE